MDTISVGGGLPTEAGTNQTDILGRLIGGVWTFWWLGNVIGRQGNITGSAQLESHQGEVTRQ